MRIFGRPRDPTITSQSGQIVFEADSAGAFADPVDGHPVATLGSSVSTWPYPFMLAGSAIELPSPVVEGASRFRLERLSKTLFVNDAPSTNFTRMRYAFAEHAGACRG